MDNAAVAMLTSPAVKRVPMGHLHSRKNDSQICPLEARAMPQFPYS